jgi:hypothetical protein
MALEEDAGANIFRQAAQMALNSSQDHIGQQERCSHAANLIIVHFLECAAYLVLCCVLVARANLESRASSLHGLSSVL